MLTLKCKELYAKNACLVRKKLKIINYLQNCGNPYRNKNRII